MFRRYFLGADPGPAADVLALTPQAVAQAQAVLDIPATEPPGDDAEEEQQEARLGLMASDAEVLRRKRFTDCTPEELAALRRIMARLRLTPPRRRTRRWRSGPSGPRPDLRRTVRESLRMHGEPGQLYWRRRRVRLRPLILILDVSGSMADYSRALLQFAYSAKRAAARVEVFCFGTRLTRISKALDHRRPDRALEAAARAVFDWEGGTRIGDCLDAFIRRVGPAGHGPRRDRRDLLRRARPGRSGHARGGHAAALPAELPGGVDEPAPGRATGHRCPRRSACSPRSRTSTCCCPAGTWAAWSSSRRCCRR